ncbi:MAG: saccharopine dehydrogenase, partial [Pseudomonadota bacterium]
MVHLWVRSEQRTNEERVGVTPQGAAKLIAAGFRVTVEESAQRTLPIADYAAAGCEIAPEFSWVDAPDDAIIVGLKELPEDGTPLRHAHVMFGHAYKGQPAGQVLLGRFKAGGGRLLDLEYLTDADGRRVAAFGYWAGYAGAAVSLMCWIAQQQGRTAGAVNAYPSANHMLADLQQALISLGTQRPTALIIGALGRVGTGAADLCQAMGVATTKWDMAETK